MAAVPVTIVGTFTSADGTAVGGTLEGSMHLTGLGVGGGPMPGGPPGVPAHPIYNPPGIWGPTDPRPMPPIYLPPGSGPGEPPGIWGPSDPRPTPPIVIPRPPPEAPNPPPGGGAKPPPPEGGWGYHPEYGWGYFPGEGEAGPKR